MKSTYFLFAKSVAFVRQVAMKRRILSGWLAIAMNNLNGHRKNKPVVIVLSLNHFGPSPEVSKRAYHMGYRVHIFSSLFPVHESQYSHGWSRLNPLEDFKKALAKARALSPVAILVEGKNLLLPLQNYLASELNLVSIGERAVETSNSKIALRTALDKAGVRNVPWLELENYRNGNFNFPCILKPDLGTASKGVCRVSSDAELAFFLKQHDLYETDSSVGDRMLLEGLVEGRQFDLEGIAIDGEYYLFCIVEEYYEAMPPYFPASWFHFNPPLEPQQREALINATESALRAFGVKNGAWHVEQRINKNGDVYIVDYANRMGYNNLVSMASGLNIAREYVDSMVSGKRKRIDVKPKSLIKIYAYDKQTQESMKKLVKSNSEFVRSHSFLPSVNMTYPCFGSLLLESSSYEGLHHLLSQNDLLPSQFEHYYQSKKGV